MHGVIWTNQPGLSAMVQYFSLTTKQYQPTYQLQKPSTEQLNFPTITIQIIKYHFSY